MKTNLWIVDGLGFISLLLTALVVGAMFGVWLSSNPAGMNFSDYLPMQKRNIRAFNRTLPLLGVLAALCTVGAAVLSIGQGTQFPVLAGAAICLIAAGVITRFCNQPINAIVMSWSLEPPPNGWTQVRDTWWRWHIGRLIFGIIGLSLLILAALQLGR